MEDDAVILKSSSDLYTIIPGTIGRVMNTLLTSRPKKLEFAISCISPNSPGASIVSLDESLRYFNKYVEDAVDKEEDLDDILIPMIEHSLKCKKSKYCDQTMILLNWIFEDDLIFQAMATNLANILLKKEDRYITLGWCTFVRGILEYDFSTRQHAMHGIREKYNALLIIFTPCIPHLLSIVCSRSIIQDGHELPTRLSVTAADCILALTESLVRKQLHTESSNKLISSDPNASNRPSSLVSTYSNQNKVKSVAFLTSVKMDLLLSDHLNELIILLQRLISWSKKSRDLHAKGLERVLNWLQEIKGSYCCSQDEADFRNLNTGVLLLSSCWKHYGMLLHLEDHKFIQNFKGMLDQYLSGIQFYTENCTEEHADSGVETRKFFLNCLFLLLGRLNSKQLESTISEYGLQISQVLISQLHCDDEDLIHGAVHIFKAVIFKRDSSTRGILFDTKYTNVVLPCLLNLLDEQDGTARAAVKLAAEYCFVDDHCLQEILKRCGSGTVIRRSNAIDVISELIHISPYAVNVFPHTIWQDIAKHLIDRIEDREVEIRVRASNLLPLIEPSLVVPALVCLVYSSFDRVPSHASDALMAVLKYHSERHEVICMLLDCLSNLDKTLPNTIGIKEDESGLNTDRVLRLIPEWSKSVQNWSALIEPLIGKMFAEPSNATIVRFLSYISDYLGEVADVVLHHVLLHIEGQEEIGERLFSQCGSKPINSSDSVKLQQSLFDHLCPLLVIRLLPLRVFNDVNFSIVYGKLNKNNTSGDDNVYINKCVAAFLLSRAFCKFEFEDVRKLAAELCGRIHPQILFPIISSQLERATRLHDMLKIKACLFSVCTSLVVRGSDSILHSSMLRIRKSIKTILLWSSRDGDEVSKAQHGCIDCLALMICVEAELHDPPSFKTLNMREICNDGDAEIRPSVISYVIHKLSNYEKELPVSFYLCMANVLISACQKISSSGKTSFAQETLPGLLHSVRIIKDSEIRAACIQVMFSLVYHLKSAIFPYAPELFKISLKSLRKGSDKEKMASAKLMASLMASEDAILKSLSGELLETRKVLANISLTDPSTAVRQICEKLLGCVTSA